MRDFHEPGRSTVYATDGMVATSHPIASKVAIDTLQSGGNAIDAALAAALLLPICEPQMTGLCGDMFALVKLPGSEKVIGLNSSGKSPKNITGQKLRQLGMDLVPSDSPHAITMPGAIAGFETLAQDFSNFGLSTACQPAIHYAKQGIPVSPRVAFDWKRNESALSEKARCHYLIDGKVPEEGNLFKAPLQAKVLEKIATFGAKGFYEGDVGKDIVKSLQNLGGFHTADDLVQVSSEYVNPWSSTYRNVELIELPPNGQGATALLLANILSNFSLIDLDPFGYERIHLEAEASKLAYKMRNQYLSDRDSLPQNFSTVLTAPFARKLASSININKASPNLSRSTEEFHLDTVLLTVVDKNRCAISLIFSIFHAFGSGHVSEKYGLLFQNRGAGFTLEKNHPNELAGAKKPLHTIIPAMVKKNGKLIMTYGVMGGQYQPVGHVRILSNLIDYKNDIQSSIDMPRSFADSSGLILENGYDDSVAVKLKDLGHSIIRPEAPLGGAQAILINQSDNVLIGASDGRKDGIAIGF